jgi:hypothetical protein
MAGRMIVERKRRTRRFGSFYRKTESKIMTFNPKTLFIIDGLGALVSAFLLGVVLVQFKSLFGMPKETLYLLAFLPCLFALYDLFCYLKVTKNELLFLKGIALANLLYCCLSIGLVSYHYNQLTNLGIAYFVLELLVVLVLVSIQLKTTFKN